MKTPLEVIEQFGIPTHSYTASISFLYDPGRPVIHTQRKYEETIAEIIGLQSSPTYSNEKEARLVFMYTVQETVRAFLSDTIPDMEDVWEDVIQRTDKFIKQNPWSIKEYSTYDEDNPPTDEDNVPKKRKGAKKLHAEQLYQDLNDGVNDRLFIIDQLIEQVGLTKSGATTYFHNLKQQYGYKGPIVVKQRVKKKAATAPKPTKPKKKGPSKSQIAKDVYKEMKGKPKPEIIAEIMNKANTSKAGANTYFCSCKKEFGV